MHKLILFVVLVPAIQVAHSQGTTTTITDSQGNQTTATLDGDRLYLFDTQGHAAYGTIRDGNIFLSNTSGGTVFGTIRDGNVFLHDSKGTTTGSIRDGSIFISNSDGSTTTGTYSNGYVFTTTVLSPDEQRRRQEQQQRQLDYQRQVDQQNYENGRAAGEAIGRGIAAAIANHRITSFCKQHPTGTFKSEDGVSYDCPQAELTEWQKKEVDEYCYDHPGLYIQFGRHRVDCYTAPSPATLAWAKWEMNTWQWNYRNYKKLKMNGTIEQVASEWQQWKRTFCSLSSLNAAYKDLDNKKQHCE